MINKPSFSTSPGSQDPSLVHSQTYIVTFFSGIDTEYIDVLYFSGEQEKEKYLRTLQQSLADLGISDNTTRTDAIEKISGQEEQAIDTDTLRFESWIVTERNEKVIRAVQTEPAAGKDKLLQHYTALKVIRENLQRKTDPGCFDFAFEEQLLSGILTDNKRDFARLDTLYRFGEAFHRAGDSDKSDAFFEKIFADTYDLSASTVAEFYRSIGELYAQNQQNDVALRWLKKGLTLHPKLGVKKYIAQLEKKGHQNK